MDLVRLGDRIDWKAKHDPEREPLEVSDYLAQKVFDPKSDQSAVKGWYLQSQPLSHAKTFAKQMPGGTPALGQFEARLLHKLLKPRRPVICVRGPIGCGKTTVKNFVALSLVASRKHVCEVCLAGHKRLIGQVDFDQHAGLNDFSPCDLTQVLAELLCDELRARVTASEVLGDSGEFGGFWAHEIADYKVSVSPSKAFRAIIAKSGAIGDLESGTPSDEQVSFRRDLLEHISTDFELRLDYLVRLWRYMISAHFGGNRGCAFILLDNVDRVAPEVQRRLLELVLAHGRLTGPTFVLFMRPETVARVGLAVNIVDMVNHEGPTPLQVILDRWQRFCDSPDSFFESDGALAKPVFDQLKTFLGRLLVYVRGDAHNVLQTYLEHSCGRSVRLALLTAQSLFSLSPHILSTKDISISAVVRTCIRHGEGQFHWSSGHTTEHLFRVSNGSGDDKLVKPRVLRYLGRRQDGKRRLNEVYNELIGFGYSPSTIQKAINDLMQLNHQLIMSDGFDFFYESEALEDFGGYSVMLTDIGRGYSQNLMMDIDYVQEVMLDTMVDGDRFSPNLSFGYIREKFTLLLAFLDELRALDVRETTRFVEAFTTRSYSEAFGQHLISLDVIQGIYGSAKRILAAVEDKAADGAPSYGPIREQLRSLVLQVEGDNNNILGVWAQSVIAE